MLVRLGCCVVLTAWVLLPHAAHAQNCAEEISRLMSKDTEKLTTRYNRVTKQIQEKGANPKLVQEECRIARELGPREGLARHARDAEAAVAHHDDVFGCRFEQLGCERPRLVDDELGNGLVHINGQAAPQAPAGEYGGPTQAKL